MVSTGLRNVTQAVGSLVAMYMISPMLTGYLMGIVPIVIVVGTSFGPWLAAGWQARRGVTQRRAPSVPFALLNAALLQARCSAVCRARDSMP